MPPPAPTFTISPATTSDDLSAIRTLFGAYTEWLGLDLTYQNYASEFASLPGKYAPPTGALFLAREVCSSSGSPSPSPPLGCIALRPLPSSSSSSTSSHSNTPSSQPNPASAQSTPRIAELKRLYTTPSSRGTGLGRTLVEVVIKEARALGYHEVVLDTLPHMMAAKKLYGSVGFVRVGAYYETPVVETEFFRLKL